jgi:hypothetical protein
MLENFKTNKCSVVQKVVKLNESALNEKSPGYNTEDLR